MDNSKYHLKYDAAAVALVRDGSEDKGAVMFKGWLAPTKPLPSGEGEVDLKVGDADKKVRLISDPQGLEWLVIDVSDIIYQVPAAAHDPEGGSVIWVKREAWIKRSERGRAFWFEQRRLDTADDPTARHPPPPH